MAIEEDLDLEEIGGVTKTGRQTRSRGNPKKAAKPRVSYHYTIDQYIQVKY